MGYKVGLATRKPFSDWEQETIEGNKFFDRHDFRNVQKNYVRAKLIPAKLFNSCELSNTDRSVSALAVSYHNLADLYQQKNQLQRAYQELDEIDSYLVKYLENIATNSEAHSAVKRGINKPRTELFKFIQRNKIIRMAISKVGDNK